MWLCVLVCSIDHSRPSGYLGGSTTAGRGAGFWETVRVHFCVYVFRSCLVFSRVLTDLSCHHRRALSRRLYLFASFSPGLSQQIQEVTVDWSEYTGIFDGFEVCFHPLALSRNTYRTKRTEVWYFPPVENACFKSSLRIHPFSYVSLIKLHQARVRVRAMFDCSVAVMFRSRETARMSYVGSGQRDSSLKAHVPRTTTECLFENRSALQL